MPNLLRTYPGIFRWLSVQSRLASMCCKKSQLPHLLSLQQQPSKTTITAKSRQSGLLPKITGVIA